MLGLSHCLEGHLRGLVPWEKIGHQWRHIVVAWLGSQQSTAGYSVERSTASVEENPSLFSMVSFLQYVRNHFLEITRRDA